MDAPEPIVPIRPALRRCAGAALTALLLVGLWQGYGAWLSAWLMRHVA